MINFYPNLIVCYVYGETSDVLKFGIKSLLFKDSELYDLYFQLKESRYALNDFLQPIKPSKACVQRILQYAAS